MIKWIYIVYSREHKADYVGKTCNLKQRFYKHCTYVKGCVKQFCINHNNIKPRYTFDIYEIMKCDVTDASYYEGRTYDLIQQYFPYIKLINKNKPNRSNKQWYANNAERCRANNKIWRTKNIEFERQRKKWRINNLEHIKQYYKQWRANNPEYHKEYYKKQKLINK